VSGWSAAPGNRSLSSSSGHQRPPFSVIVRTTDAKLSLVAALRRAARERGRPLPSIDVADALLDERRELTGLPRLTSCLDKHSMEPLIAH
jgi:hypothetical protein